MKDGYGSHSFVWVALGLLAGCGGATQGGEGAGGGRTGAGGTFGGSSVAGGGTAGMGAIGASETAGRGGAATGTAGTGAAPSTGAVAGTNALGGTGSASTGTPSTLPCGVLEGAGHRCVAAHSTVRVLVSGYMGSLYRVERGDGQSIDIGAVEGYADAAAQTKFCSVEGCVIKVIYDQSSMGNDLTVATAGSAKPTPARPVDAKSHPVKVSGREVYGMLFRPNEGYRKTVGNGTAVGDEPQTIYMVSSQHDLINGCCFDYGNAETTNSNDGNGAAESVYLGHGVIWGTGVGDGPWVMADLENGLYPGWEAGADINISTNTPVTHDFVTAVLVGDTANKNGGKGRFALYGGDATTGQIRTMYDGIRPEKPGYVPMAKQGGIVLAVAGDNSNGAGGRFYEGVIALGAATKETVDALQAVIIAAGYGK